MTDLKVITHQAVRDAFTDFVNTRCFSKAGLAEGTNDHTIKIAAPNGAGVDYAIDGVMYHKADADNIAITAASVQAVSTYCKYLVSLNASGDVTVTKGTVASTAAAAVLPDVPASQCPIGYFQIATDANTQYTAGTTDNGAAGITDTYVDLSHFPTSHLVD